MYGDAIKNCQVSPYVDTRRDPEIIAAVLAGNSMHTPISSIGTEIGAIGLPFASSAIGTMRTRRSNRRSFVHFAD